VKQIALAYNQYWNEHVNHHNIHIESKPSDFLRVMELSKRESSNDPNMYTFFANSLTTPVVKRSITDGARADDKAWRDSGPIGFSVHLIINVPIDACPSTTHMLFMTELPIAGKWPATGVYET
jgi:hypothetical protein